MKNILKTCAIFLKIHRGLIFTDGGTQVTFIKDDKGEAMAISRHNPGLPDSEGKKLKNK
jgi:hypothetical protein